MAPISEKKSPPQFKENIKENIAAVTFNKKSTLEILDFRESWLKELKSDARKDQVQNQKLLGSHNHTAHSCCSTAEGCPHEISRNASVASKRSDQIRIRKRIDKGQPPEQKDDIAEIDLILKRARMDINTKRRTSQEPVLPPNIATSRSSNTCEPNGLIIVNPFHASGIAHLDKCMHKAFVKPSATKPINVIGPTSRIPNRPESIATSCTNNKCDDSTKRTPEAHNDESEEEYFGFPFVLSHDSIKTHQSENIRYYGSEVVSESNGGADINYYTPQSALTPSLFPMVPPYLTFSSHCLKGPSLPASLRKVLKWKISPAMPKLVKRVVLNSGHRLIKKTTDWMAVWERHMKSPGFKTIRSHQKYNHLPGTFRLGRKDTMWKSLQENILKFGKKEFGIQQKSFVMPEDLDKLKSEWPRYSKKSTKWIVKPPASARGCGITVINKWSQFPKDIPLVVQKYIERPLLINENKFDIRLYVLVTSVNPLRIFMYKDGLARFASVKYNAESNSLDEKCMHLTNYSINKFSENYAKNEDVNACQGHKWTLQSLWSFLEKRNVNTNRLWAAFRNLVIKAIICGESGLNRTYRQNLKCRYNCFELLGFDVLLDENLIPWLLEINISPSLHSELALDWHVKGPLVQGILNTVLYQVPPKLSEKQQSQILKEMNLPEGPLCYDERIFTTYLTAEEVRKHNQFTNPSIEYREEYLEAILEDLKPDDIRCLIILEDEFNRSKPLERIFPNAESHIYLKYIENPRYYNRLIDAWENRYAHRRQDGIALLTKLCSQALHLQVPAAALQKEEDVELTEIDLLYTKKNYFTAPVDKTDDFFVATDNNNTHNGVVADPNRTDDFHPDSSVSPTVDESYAENKVSCSKEASTNSETSKVQTRPRPIAVATNYKQIVKLQ